MDQCHQPHIPRQRGTNLVPLPGFSLLRTCIQGLPVTTSFTDPNQPVSDPVSPAQRPVPAGAQKANSYVQPSTFDILAGASPASAMDGWAE